ncbi:hypothetical protein [Arcobacter ellisii]|uniref:Membrane protein n=1 Tax=Arcobacter ellisii TaxID=913109 RepID=A0ABM6YQL2_9BACT|nr:hypothetical protein [Arcobacter ellisii]AXX95878.1 putative membrane protein [Arcobacter ellisii]
MKIFLNFAIFIILIYSSIKLHKYLLKKYNSSPFTLFNVVLFFGSFFITSFLIYFFEK